MLLNVVLLVDVDVLCGEVVVKGDLLSLIVLLDGCYFYLCCLFVMECCWSEYFVL